MKIVTLMDNMHGERKDLTAEHGLSLFVQTKQVCLLFDFGAGAHTYENAVRLNIRLDQMDYAVCSHGHYDHGAGYREFVQNGLLCPLVTGREFFTEKYAVNGLKAAYLGTGFDEDFLISHHIPRLVCGTLLSLAPGCWVMGGFHRERKFETIPERFVIREQNAWEPDSFQDEICLILEENGELTVIVGCSHPGILNILDTVKERFSQPIRTVIGGTHLVKADPERIGKTIEVMKEMGINRLGFNHCSGELFREMIEKEKMFHTVYLGVGDCYMS